MIEVAGVTKRFGSVVALSDVSARFEPGEIHAVVGENGAGKSTLMHIIAGFSVPDSGSVKLDGTDIPYGKPFSCRKLGIGMIHQHFTLVPEFTVAENLALAKLERLAAPCDVAAASQPALALAKELAWSVDPRAKVSKLPVGVQQRVEILKTLAGEVSTILFDEPTAVLSPEEVEDLARVLTQLKGAGKTVILIAHKLSEVFAMADRVTVLRKGKVTGEARISEIGEQQLAHWMVGELPPNLTKLTTHPTEVGLTIRDLRVRGDRGELAVKCIDLEVRRGEIVGLGGVDGNGQVELAEAVAAVRPFTGSIHFSSGSPRIAYIPQDRQTDGLALTMSLEENFLISGQARAEFLRGPVLVRRKIAQWSDDLIDRFEIKVKSRRESVSNLSGGNQQKVVVARNLDQAPDLLVAVNPTRGLDIKAADYVHRRILEASANGAAVLLISTDLDELAAVADRTLFLSRGELHESATASDLVGGQS